MDGSSAGAQRYAPKSGGSDLAASSSQKPGAPPAVGGSVRSYAGSANRAASRYVPSGQVKGDALAKPAAGKPIANRTAAEKPLSPKLQPRAAASGVPGGSIASKRYASSDRLASTAARPLGGSSAHPALHDRIVNESVSVSPRLAPLSASAATGGACFNNPAHGCGWGWGWNHCGYGWNACWDPCCTTGFGFGFGWSSCFYFSSWWPYHCYSSSCWYDDWCYGWSRPWGYGSYWWWPETCYCPTYLVTAPVANTPVVYEHALSGEANAAPARSRELTPAEIAAKYVSLGDFYFKEGRFAEAVDAYTRARTNSPKDPTIDFVLADAAFATGDYHFAAFLIGESLKLDAEMAKSEADKRLFYGDVKVFEQQLDTLRKYLAEKPYDAMATLVLGYNLKFSGRPEEARKAFQRVVEIDPGNTTATLFLAALPPAGEKGEKKD